MAKRLDVLEGLKERRFGHPIRAYALGRRFVLLCDRSALVRPPEHAGETPAGPR
jgi:hypothetical protein